MDLKWLDALEFELIPAPVSYNEVPRLSVSAGGQVRLNAAFLKRVGETRRFCGKVSKDGGWVTLQADSGGQLYFTPKGVQKNAQFIGRLREKGVEFPVIYSMEWIAERNLWAGSAGRLPAPPPAGTLLPNKRGGKRNGK